MLANIKPGKPARLIDAVTTPALMALIEAKRRGLPLEPLTAKIMRSIGFDSFIAHLVDKNKPLMTRVAPLSTRTRKCLELAANGMTSRDIGVKLGITDRTANFHCHNTTRKMAALNRKDAIAVGTARGGWVPVESSLLNSGSGKLKGALRHESTLPKQTNVALWPHLHPLKGIKRFIFRRTYARKY